MVHKLCTYRSYNYIETQFYTYVCYTNIMHSPFLLLQQYLIYIYFILISYIILRLRLETLGFHVGEPPVKSFALQVRRTEGKCLIWGRAPKVIRAKYRLENGQQKESLLLVSGWWGVARHFHYIPELGLAFFWCLPGLFENVMCYTYFIWLVILLIHRTFRDDAKCSAKYGKYWKQYCQSVPYRMLPYVFWAATCSTAQQTL